MHIHQGSWCWHRKLIARVFVLLVGVSMLKLVTSFGKSNGGGGGVGHWVRPRLAARWSSVRGFCRASSTVDSPSLPICETASDTLAVSKTFHPRLLAHLEQSLQQRIDELVLSKHWSAETVNSALISQRLLHCALQQAAVTDNRQLHDIGTCISYALGGLKDNEIHQLTSPLITNDDTVITIIEKMIQNYRANVQRNKEMFDNIHLHHKRLADASTWQEALQENEQSIKDYATAAQDMGKRHWVKQSNDWMADFIVSYFRFGGAKKHYCKQHNIVYQQKKRANEDMTTNPLGSERLWKDVFQQTSTIGDIANNVSSGDAVVASPLRMSRRIRVLDVGSCYNPLESSPSAAHLEITAVDLCPATDSVIECDFLALRLGDRNSQPVFDVDPITKKRRLVQLPRESFDAVTMSLVLSYLPTPTQREEMIAKAQALLISPNDEHVHCPHHAGLLLIIEKPSIFTGNFVDSDSGTHWNADNLRSEWKQSIKMSGFEFVKYTHLTTSPGRWTHAFAFAKLSATAHALQDSQHVSGEAGANHPKAKYRMWIQQDLTRLESDSDNNRVSSIGEGVNGHKHDQPSVRRIVSSKGLFRSAVNDKYYPIGIVGGGLGGAALALALQQRGLPYQIFERDLDFHSRRQGYALTMQQGGIALREFGLTDHILQEGAVSVMHHSYTSEGRLIGEYGAGKREGHALFDEAIIRAPQELKHRTNVHIPRQRLRELLINQVEPTHIQWNKRLIGFEQATGIDANRDNEAIRLRFTDNSESIVSVLVGADGVFSNVRQQLMQSLSPDYLQLSYLKLLVILGISDQKSTIDGEHLCVRQWVDGHNRVFSMPFDKEKTMWQMSFPMSESQAQSLSSLSKHQRDSSIEEREAVIGQRLKAEALERCRGWHAPLVQLLESTHVEDITGHPVYDRDPHLGLLPRASPLQRGLSSRVTLLGDAAHPMSPFKGQGANQALLDAIHLARALSSSAFTSSGRMNISDSLRDFEADMMFRVSAKVLKSREAAEYLHCEAAMAEGNITRAKAAQNWRSSTA